MNAQAIPTPQAGASTAAAVPPPSLLVNPRSYTVANRRLATRAIALAQSHGAGVIEADGPAAMADGLDRALAQGTRRLFVLAGDGTVQALVDHLAALPADALLPQLLLLPGGRTNFTADDLAGGHAVLKRLESALRRAARGPAGGFELQYRHALMIEQPPAHPRHGFFLAAAIIDRLIRGTHRYRATGSGRLRTGRSGLYEYLVKAAIPALLGHAPYASPELDVVAAGLGRLHGPARLLVATTLAHERGWFKPYAERGEGALRVTAVAAGAQRFWQSLPRLLTGRFSPAMASGQGYLSGRTGSVSVVGLDGYTLDGQSFTTDPARPVTIATGPRFTFLVP